MTTALYPGSFDPLTLGHMDVIERVARVADTLIVAVGTNVAKTPTFSVEARMEMIRAACAHLDNVRVLVMSSTAIEMAAEYGVNCIVKGVRDGADLSGEMAQAAVNRELGGVETLLIPSRGEYMHLSSTMVRELMKWGMDYSRYVPPAVLSFIGENSK